MNLEKIKKKLEAIGLEISRSGPHTSERLLVKSLLHQHQIQTLFDVGGGRDGSYAAERQAEGFTGTIHTFEPLSSSYHTIQQRTSTHPNWHAHHAALGKEEGNLELFVAANQNSSSLLPTASVVQQSDIVRTVGKEQVPVWTLDAFIDRLKQPPGICYLKLDVQGYEMPVLEGSLRALHLIKVVQAEVSLVDLYEHSTQIETLISFLKRNGYQLFSLLPAYYNRETGQHLQMEGFFIHS